MLYNPTKSPAKTLSIIFFFVVFDSRAAVEWLTAKGVRFTLGGIRKGASGHDVCFIHPKGSDDAPIGAEGVLVELVQAPPDVIEALRS